MDKRWKRGLCLLLSLCLLGTTAVFADTEEEAEKKPEIVVQISRVSQLQRLAERCRLDSNSRNMRVVLTKDLDLEGHDFSGFPIFCGIFDGNGHAISGLTLRGDGSAQGLFRYLTQEAQVKNLHVKATVIPGGSGCRVGALAGSNAGSIAGCRAEIRIDGVEMVGGLVGENTVTGVIQSCSVDGKVTGSHFVGGIAGHNMGVIRYCSNYTRVNTTPEENRVDLKTVTLEAITGSESVSTTTDVGGIAGHNMGVIRGCKNYGPVGYRQMGYNIGGIVGTQVGYVVDCENHAAVCGRKEVGGIVGQMEPTAYIAFEKDALQILEEQLDGLSAAAGQAAAHAQMTTGMIGGQMTALVTQIKDTGEALKALQGEDLGMDTLLAAKNVLSSSVSGMTQTMQGFAAVTQTAMGQLTNDLYAIQGQINAMRATLGNMSDNVGGMLKDLSDQDTPDQISGKVERCLNDGQIQGDLNVGGIAGAIAPENDLDLKEDFELGENNSLNFVSELRAVILNCDNSGELTVNKEAGGGIVGLMFMGLVKDCRSTGTVGSGAEHLGGIAGKSRSFIRDSSAKCRVNGSSYIGGIAGEGSTVSDCRSMVLLSGKERVGAILGYGVQDTDDEGNPKLWGNLYLKQETDPGGIDGISYEAVAQPLPEKEFFGLPALPELFSKVYLHFIHENGYVSSVEMDAGKTLDQNRLPEIPEKEGFIASWEGYKNVAYEFDESFPVLYTPMSATIASKQTDAVGRPMLLAEGSYLPDTELNVWEADSAPDCAINERLITSFAYQVTEDGKAQTLRYLIGEQSGRIKAYIRLADGSWHKTECTVLGSYGVLNAPEGAEEFAFTVIRVELWQYAAMAVGLAAVLWLTGFCLKQRKRRAKTI